MLLEGRCVYTNSPIAGAFRGYGVVQTYYALDVQMDEAAEHLGLDPAGLKLKNAVREGDIAPSNHPLIGHGLEACIEKGMELVDWPALRRRPRDTSGPIRTGWGLGCEMHGSSAYPGIKEQGNAIIKMNEDGTVVLLTGAAGLGTGAHTALAQIVAEELTLPFEAVAVVHGDTDVVPWDIGAFASHTTYMVGKAAQMAAGEIKRQLFDRAAKLMECEPEALTLTAGVIAVRDRDGPTLTVREAVMPRKGSWWAPPPITRPSRIHSPRILSRWRSIPKPASSPCSRWCQCMTSAR